MPPRLIFTGQHAGLDPAEFGLEIYSADHLACRGEEDPHRHVRNVTAAIAPLLSEPPHLLVVQGDTSSALGAALGAFTGRVSVAHVEAGLRTYDPLLPWPEEEYRTAIDAQADLLFAPTGLAAANLHAEGVPGHVHVTGNSGIDALIAVERTLPAPSLQDSGTPRLLVTCHRRESWGEGLQLIAAALIDIASSGKAEIDVILHPNEHVAAMLRQALYSKRGISLVPPCSHRELVRRMRDADLVLSDSGGMQEEAPALGTPILVLREKTERPEAVDSGNALLVGTSAERITAEVRRLIDDPAARYAMARPAFPFGDGRAAPRIARIIEEWLEPRCKIAQPPRLQGTRSR
jgi:UDP-N-acetylglucosamine 2-epimerase (non-hydrolysing)